VWGWGWGAVVKLFQLINLKIISGWREVEAGPALPKSCYKKTWKGVWINYFADTKRIFFGAAGENLDFFQAKIRKSTKEWPKIHKNSENILKSANSSPAALFFTFSAILVNFHISKNSKIQNKKFFLWKTDFFSCPYRIFFVIWKNTK